MSFGTEPTPILLMPRYSKTGDENLQIMLNQLITAGASENDIARFTACVKQLREHNEGQIVPLSEAAHAIHAEVHWTN
jgi:hypothetical protein